MGLIEQATDPSQYDKAEAGWSAQGLGLQSPTRAHFWQYIKPFTKAWNGLDLLDIGTGTAWFPAEAAKGGLNSVTGIEPSTANVELARQLHPEVKLVQSTFTEFQSPQRFGVVTAIMVLPHIDDLDAFFSKVAWNLHQLGEFLAIVPDYDHHRTERYGYKIEIEELNQDEYVVACTRPHGTIVDIVRRVEVYQRAASQRGLVLVRQLPMVPTEGLIQSEPKYQEFAGIPMTHLLRFYPGAF